MLHFDLRIAGFADLSSLYISLSEQMEQYFLNISTEMQGYEEFEKESWAFKVCSDARGCEFSLTKALSTTARTFRRGSTTRRMNSPFIKSVRATLRVSWSSSRWVVHAQAFLL